jgi:hypothetical protein
LVGGFDVNVRAKISRLSAADQSEFFDYLGRMVIWKNVRNKTRYMMTKLASMA